MAKPCEICPYNKEWKRTGRCDHLCIMNPEPQTNANQHKKRCVGCALKGNSDALSEFA